MTSYLNQNLTSAAVRFGADSLSQTAARCAKNTFDPVTNDKAQRGQLLSQDTLFQILELEDTSLSRTAELEMLNELESDQNTNTDKLRKNVNKKKTPRAITSIDMDNQNGNNINNGDDDAGSAGETGNNNSRDRSLYKLLLQDSAGHLVFAIELEKLNFLKEKPNFILPIHLGSKIVIKKSTTTLRGCLMLTNKDCMFLGGEISVLNQNYVKRRIARLTNDLQNNGTTA